MGNDGEKGGDDDEGISQGLTRANYLVNVRIVLREHHVIASRVYFLNCFRWAKYLLGTSGQGREG